MTDFPELPELVTRDDIVIAPGIYDALGALLAERAGFQAAYLSGASIAYTRFGRPDIGLVGMSEVADTLSAISERARIRLIVDADTGFGNALNVTRTVRLFESIGASAIQIEDQTLPKRCGHLSGKTLVSTGEMIGKIKAAVDTRRSDKMLVIARTDGIAVEGFEAALDRAERYGEAGADILFVEAPRDRDQLATTAARLGGRWPLLANMVEGGKTPHQSAVRLQELGYALAIFPGGMVRAIAKTMQAYLASLGTHGTNLPFRERMLDFDGLNGVLETDAHLELGNSYDAGQFQGECDD